MLADDGSILELRPSFAPGMVTALARVEGRALGIVANNPVHGAGAIDADGADKAARFMQLCEAFDLPLLLLCDTPGIMVGPDAEKTALVRHVSRMFVTGASLTVPFTCVVLRKGYGLGAQAMAGGSFHGRCSPWPGPPGSSAAWGSRGPSGWDSAASWTPSRTPDERERRSRPWSPAPTSTARRCNVAALLRDRRRDRPGSQTRTASCRHALDTAGPRVEWTSPGRHRRPFVDTW